MARVFTICLCNFFIMYIPMVRLFSLLFGFLFSDLAVCSITPSLNNPVLSIQATYDLICSTALTVTRICLCSSPNRSHMLPEICNLIISSD